MRAGDATQLGECAKDVIGVFQDVEGDDDRCFLVVEGEANAEIGDDLRFRLNVDSYIFRCEVVLEGLLKFAGSASDIEDESVPNQRVGIDNGLRFCQRARARDSDESHGGNVIVRLHGARTEVSCWAHGEPAARPSRKAVGGGVAGWPGNPAGPGGDATLRSKGGHTIIESRDGHFPESEADPVEHPPRSPAC